MIRSDIILMGILVIFVVIILNLNIINAKKIRKGQSEAKLKEIKENTKVSSETFETSNDDDNYLHDYFNADSVKNVSFNDIDLQEVSESELNATLKAVGKTKKFNASLPEYEDEFNNSSNIVKELDDHMDDQFEYEKDYEIGIDDEDDVEFTNVLSEEFKSLSPAMKAFIMSNVLKSKQDEHNDDNNNI